MYQLRIFVRACEVHKAEGQKTVDFAMLVLPRWLPKTSPWKRPKKGEKPYMFNRQMRDRLAKVLGTDWQPKSYNWAVNNAELSRKKRHFAQRMRVQRVQKKIQGFLDDLPHQKPDVKKAIVPIKLFNRFSLEKKISCHIFCNLLFGQFKRGGARFLCAEKNFSAHKKRVPPPS